MGPVRRASAPFFLCLLVVSAAGCGGSKHEASSDSLPSCAKGRPVRSGDFPAGFPVPRGTVVTSRYRQSGARVVQGYSAGGLDSVRDFFHRQLPAKGFELGEGDAEEDEAETDFSGAGTKGHLKLNEDSSCEGAVRVAVVTRPS
jgi:hypothetical protein